MNRDNITLNPNDIDKIIITKVLFKGTDFVKDIRVEFPESYNIDPISFMDIGLINVLPEPIEYTEDTNIHNPKVKMELWGILETVEE